MNRENNRNIKLGLFLLSGGVALVFALYYIGSRQNLFGDTFALNVRFHNVNGLMEGNNVRFAGIDVGTVASVEIENDSMVIVKMVLENRVRPFVKKNSLASVGSDGLMGNKLVNINPSPDPGSPVSDGDVLESLRPIEMDEMVRTLNVTNDNILVVTRNLRVITDNISNRNSFWHLLADSTLAKDVKYAVTGIRHTADNASAATFGFRQLVADVNAGHGIGVILRDSVFAGRVSRSARNLELLSDSGVVIASRLAEIVSAVSKGEGSLGQLVRDTGFVFRLKEGVVHIDTAAVNFDRNMKAVRYSWPFKKGFRNNKLKK